VPLRTDEVTLNAPAPAPEPPAPQPPRHAKPSQGGACALVPPDAELVTRSVCGEREAFEPLVRRYSDDIVRFVHHMLGDFQTAEDIAQETFVKAFSHLKRLEQPERFSTWLYSIARHACLDHMRAKRTGPSVEDLSDAGVEICDAESLSPDEPVVSTEMHDEVVEELQKLRADYREVILLKHVRDLSYKEIGEIVGLSPSAVGEKLSRVRQMLRARLRRRLKK
jgi:RNA polymerase sigma-70 factor (ECF subfamily)